MFLASLRERTRSHHERLESRLDIFRLAESPDAYRAYLGRVYGFYGTVEASLTASRFADAWWNGAAYSPEAWRKMPLLARDLESLGVTSEQRKRLSLCDRPPFLETHAEALGCLYVLEGATLGGQIISRHLQEAQHLTPESGAAFFQGYGAETGRMWKTFRALLTDDVESGRCDPETVIDSACETFQRYEDWVCKTIDSVR